MFKRLESKGTKQHWRSGNWLATRGQHADWPDLEEEGVRWPGLMEKSEGIWWAGRERQWLQSCIEMQGPGEVGVWLEGVDREADLVKVKTTEAAGGRITKLYVCNVYVWLTFCLHPVWLFMLVPWRTYLLATFWDPVQFLATRDTMEQCIDKQVSVFLYLASDITYARTHVPADGFTLFYWSMVDGV